MRTRRQHGFTLTELMVTMAIVGVLAVAAVALLRTTPQPVDTASQISSKLAEASRKAISYGAVRVDVAAAQGSTARTRVVFIASATGTTLTAQYLEEAPSPSTSASWITFTSARMHRDTILTGYTASAVLTSGTPAVAIGSSGTFEVRCNPNGSCDGITIYLANRNGAKKARVVILPLGGTPMTFNTW